MAHDILSPGTSVQIRDNTTYPATSQGAVSATAGFAEKGPVNEPTLIISKDDYINTFGEPIADNPFMGMFADKFLEVSTGWFTRIAKEKDYEKVCGTAQPSLDFTGKSSPEFWVKLDDFPLQNNGRYRVTFSGGSAFTDLDALISELNTAFESVTLADGSTLLSNYLTVEESEENPGRICIRSDNYMNVRITLLSPQDSSNDPLGTSGTGHLGIEDGASSEDVGAINRAKYTLPVNESEATSASISSSSSVTQEQLNQISAFNLIDLKVDGESSNPYRTYEDINIVPTSGSPATFPYVPGDNDPILTADLSTSSFDIELSGFYDFLSGDGTGDINTTFTITTSVDGSTTAFTLTELVNDLNTQLSGATTSAGTLQDYIQFEEYESTKIRITNGSAGLQNFGSQVSITISDNTGDVTDLGYSQSPTTGEGEDSTWTLTDVAEKISNQVAEVDATASSDILTIESQTAGGTSFVEINEATTAEDSAVATLNFIDGDSASGDPINYDDIIHLVAKDAGSFGNNISVRTYRTTNPVTGSELNNIEVYEGDQSVEVFNNVNWLNPDADNYIKTMLEDSSYITVDFGETVQYPNEDTSTLDNTSINTTDIPVNDEPGNPERWMLSGGNDGVPSDQTEIDSMVATALDEYLNKEQYQIDILLAPGFVGTPVVSKLQSIGEARRDLLVLIDPPSFLDWKEIINWHNGQYSMGSGNSVNLTSRYVVATWGWQRDFDRFNENYIDLPPSIYEAVAIARTQNNYELWEAPAGPTRGLVNSISSYTRPTQQQREYLYSDVDHNCINPIVQFPNQGTMIYGQKTCLRLTKAMNRINVVRLVNHISRNVKRIGDKYIFELTNPTTWGEIERELRTFLGNIQTRGGLNDFNVIFNADTNTPARQDQGIMYGQIYIQPVRVAERIFIDLTIQRTGAEAAAQ